MLKTQIRHLYISIVDILKILHWKHFFFCYYRQKFSFLDQNMKTKVLITLIICSSLISWVIGSYVFLYYVSPELNQVITKTITKETIKDGQIITVTDLQSEITNLISKVGPSVVNIIIKKDIDLYRRDPWWFFSEKVGSEERQIGGWSGFFVDKSGIIMTNKHVVYDSQAKYTVITNEWKEYDASVVALDPLTDLAIIKIEQPDEEFQVLPIIEDESYINIWQFAIAIGNALGEFQNSVSFGVISGKNRSIEASGNGMRTEKLTWLLQTDTAINPGNSGGPLLNLVWEIVGINTAIAGNGQWLGFSIPLSQKRVNYILNSIEKYGSIKRPLIGVTYLPITPSFAREYGLSVEYGAYIPNESGSILPWSIAEKSGIETGDIILSVDGNEVNYQNTIQTLIQNKIPWDSIEIELLKKSWEMKTLSLELDEN